MCLAIPGKVVKITGSQLEIQYPHETRNALLGVESVKIGDYVMVQMGIAMKVITPAEAKDILSAWSEI